MQELIDKVYNTRSGSHVLVVSRDNYWLRVRLFNKDTGEHDDYVHLYQKSGQYSAYHECGNDLVGCT